MSEHRRAPIPSLGQRLGTIGERVGTIGTRYVASAVQRPYVQSVQTRGAGSGFQPVGSSEARALRHRRRTLRDGLGLR